MKRFKVLAVLLGLALLPNVASAGLIVSIASATGAVGDDISLDVTVRSDGSSDAFSNFVVSYVISAPGLIFYTDSLGEPNQSFLTNPSYVFFGNSASVDSGTNVGTVSTSGDTYTESDATIDFSSVPIDSTGFLLATLHLVGTSAGSYTISVDTSVSGFVNASGLSVVSFTSSSGNVTVTGTATVPEPSSLSMLMVGSAILGWSIRPRRK